MPRPRYSAHRTSFICLIFTLILLASLAILKSVFGAAGDLDPTFGVNGRVTTNLVLSDAAIQTDGKIVVVGGSGTQLSDFLVSRYNVNGSLDSSFGVGGHVTTDFFNDSDSATSIVIQSDGKIIVAGGAFDSSLNQAFALVRYNPNGSLDTTFGSNGKVTTDLGSFNSTDFAADIALQTDGKLVAVGATGSQGDDFAVVRYNSNGSLDTSFGSSGVVTTDFFGNDRAAGIAIQADNKIVAAGTAFGFSFFDADFAVARYNSNGSLDTTFDFDGKVTTNLFVDTNFRVGSDQATSVVVRTDGKIVMAGGVVDRSDNRYFALASYNANGSQDQNFWINGVRLDDFTTGSLPELANDLALQNDGRIIAVGTSNNNFTLARYDSLGSRDFAFGSPNGVVTTDFGGADSAAGVAIQTDGKIVVAGGKDFLSGALARYFSSAAQTDLSLSKTHTGNFTRAANNNYTITVTNVGTASTTGTITVTDPLPAGLNFVSATGQGWSCNHSTGTVTCLNSNSLGVNSSTSITLTVFATQNAPANVTNTANVSTAGDSNASNNSASNPTSINDLVRFNSAGFSNGEGTGTATITVSRIGGSSVAASVQYSSTAGGSANGGTGCTTGVDYIQASGTLNWVAGDSSNKTFSITICNDNIFEGNETANLALINASGATLGTPSVATLTISDNDTQPTISINDVAQTEGSSGTTVFAFTVSLSNPSTQTVSVNHSTANGSAIAGSDYQAITSTPLTFTAGQTSKSINVVVNGDTLNESNETFFVNLANATNATLVDNQGVGTITNDDPVPTGTLKISGRLVDDSARSIAGAIVLLGGAASGSSVTDSSGNYSFTNLNPGNYTVAPAVGIYSYNPANYVFNNLAGDRVANFVGTQMIVSITGRVTDSNGVGLGGVTLGLIRNGVPAGTTSTDVLGNYGFGNLSTGSNYVVTPVGSFTPGRLFFNALTTNTIGNFRSLPIASPGSAVITGRVLDANSNPIANATLTLSGPITGVTSTDEGGNYAFLNLTAGGNYAVTIQNSQYVFAPSRADFFNLASAQTFTLTAAPVAVPAPTPVASDDFTGAIRDPNKWSLGIQTQPPENFDPQVTVTQGSGQLVITPLTQAPGMHYNGYVSANAFDITNGSVSVQLAQAATGGADTVFAMGTDRNNFYRFMVRTAGPSTGSPIMIKGPDGIELPLDTTVSQLLFQVVIQGELTTLPIPYDPVQHAHLRFRHESPIVAPPMGAIVFEASPNPELFPYNVLRRKELTQRVVPSMTVELSAGTSSPTNPGQAMFMNYRLFTSTVQFSNAAYEVDEGGGSVLITVTRSGDTSEGDAIDYSTEDGTASQTTRYINTAGRLMFAPNEATQTFRVLIVDNALTEGDQSLSLLLRNPFSASLNAPGRAVLTIKDNDTTPPTSNPLDDSDAQFYVLQHYNDFLSRIPDASGLAFWTNQITSCGSDAQCIEIRRINVSAAFFLSREFQETGFFAYRFYNLALNRPNGLPRYLEFLRDAQTIGRGFIDRQPGADALLEGNKTAFANEFVGRAEFIALYPLTQSPTQFVDAIYGHAGVTPSPDERQAAIVEFNNPVGARGRVLRRVAENATLKDRERNRAFVLAQYFRYLRRDPDDAPDNNLDGYNFWLGKLNQFNGNFVNAEMVKAFITSAEYRQRFGP